MCKGKTNIDKFSFLIFQEPSLYSRWGMATRREGQWAKSRRLSLSLVRYFISATWAFLLCVRERQRFLKKEFFRKRAIFCSISSSKQGAAKMEVRKEICQKEESQKKILKSRHFHQTFFFFSYFKPLSTMFFMKTHWSHLLISNPLQNHKETFSQAGNSS